MLYRQPAILQAKTRYPMRCNPDLKQYAVFNQIVLTLNPKSAVAKLCVEWLSAHSHNQPGHPMAHFPPMQWRASCKADQKPLQQVRVSPIRRKKCGTIRGFDLVLRKLAGFLRQCLFSDN